MLKMFFVSDVKLLIEILVSLRTLDINL